MAEQAWFNGDGTEFAAPPPPFRGAETPTAAYELRPLTAGEILDRVFHLYRSNFWLFAGLASIAAAVNTATSLAQILYLHFVVAGSATGAGLSMPGATGTLFKTLGIFAFAMVAGILYLAVYSVTQAATASAVTSIYLGDATSMKQAFRSVQDRWFRFILIGLWQIWSSMWLFFALMFGGGVFAAVIASLSRGNGAVAGGAGLLVVVFVIGGLVYGVIAYIRNSFAVPAAVMEDLTVRKAMRRSKQLTSGTKGRIFLLYLLVLALYIVAIAIQSPISILILQKKSAQILLLQSISLFIGFFTGSVVGPVGAIGLCLFYLDQRIRREGFDIEFLMERSGPVPPPPVPPPTAPPPPEDAVVSQAVSVDPTATSPIASAAAETP